MSNYGHQVKKFDQNRIQNLGHIGQTFKFSLRSCSQFFSLQHQHFVLDVQTVVLVRSSQFFVRRIQLSRVAAVNIQRMINTNRGKLRQVVSTVVATIEASPITIIIIIADRSGAFRGASNPYRIPQPTCCIHDSWGT